MIKIILKCSNIPIETIPQMDQKRFFSKLCFNLIKLNSSMIHFYYCVLFLLIKNKRSVKTKTINQFIFCIGIYLLYWTIRPIGMLATNVFFLDHCTIRMIVSNLREGNRIVSILCELCCVCEVILA